MLDPNRRHLIAYLAAAAVLVVIAVRFLGQNGNDAPIPTVSMTAPAAHAPQAPRGGERSRAGSAQQIWVDVAGAVARPGLYSLPDGARVAAAIERAGGTRARADTVAVNLAAKLADGQQVVVPLRGRSGSAGTAPPMGGSAAAPLGSAAGASAAKISLSNASQEQLEQLDGVGPALAARIIAYRQAHGGFRSVDQLQEVSGFGPKRLQALRGSVEP